MLDTIRLRCSNLIFMVRHDAKDATGCQTCSPTRALAPEISGIPTARLLSP